jgi:hypothetical protein
LFKILDAVAAINVAVIARDIILTEIPWHQIGFWRSNYLNNRIHYSFDMGQKGKEMVEVDVKEVIRDLNSAYADEWLAHFQYFLYAQIIKGIDAEALEKRTWKAINGWNESCKDSCK